jgi:murein L,D-transpeptidase YcbB/YkuD
LAKAEEEGLDPEDYNLKKLTALEQRFSTLTDKELVNYDLLLTKSFQDYVSHISSGKLNPRKLYKNWDLKPNIAPVNTILKNSIRTDSMLSYITQQQQQHIVYKKLKNALKIINTFPDTDFKKITFKKKIVLNDTSNDLVLIKTRLMYWKDLPSKDSLSNIYDSFTLEGIKKFQSRHGIAADGVIGLGTINALNVSKEYRKKQIIANLERWRWFPRNMGDDYLIVNIPDFKLTVIKKQDTVATYKVIVGSDKRKTPVLTSKLNYAVFNPTWTVPPTIIKEDVIPATARNRAYLTSKNITVYNYKGEVVNLQDWDESKAKGYRYVQSPGSHNSLGSVKIIFPNRFSVYLHDTNHRNYFSRTDRSLSSGCVRVQNVLKLTEYLINDQKNWSEEKINSLIESLETTSVKIKKDYYLQQLYWTAWSEGDQLIFRKDIYSLDNNLYNMLRNQT